MEIGDALDALHLSNPQKKKRRRLSGVPKKFTQTADDSDKSVNNDKLDASTSNSDVSTTDEINKEQEPVVRRLTRKKSTPVRWTPENNVTKKKTLDTNNSKEIEKYYLNTNTGATSTSLETIFEEGSQPESSKKTMGNRKFRRFLQFDKLTKRKIKKRKENVLKFGNKKKKTIKATLNELHKRLSLLEGEDI